MHAFDPRMMLRRKKKKTDCPGRKKGRLWSNRTRRRRSVYVLHQLKELLGLMKMMS